MSCSAQLKVTFSCRRVWARAAQRGRGLLHCLFTCGGPSIRTRTPIIESMRAGYGFDIFKGCCAIRQGRPRRSLAKGAGKRLTFLVASSARASAAEKVVCSPSVPHFASVRDLIFPVIREPHMIGHGPLRSTSPHREMRFYKPYH